MIPKISQKVEIQKVKLRFGIFKKIQEDLKYFFPKKHSKDKKKALSNVKVVAIEIFISSQNSATL